MTSHPTVSVIIPCYNHGKYLERAINSVLVQSYQYFEIIVVDDGSIDDTRDVAKKFSEVNYVYQSNKGLSSARNTGIKNSKGELLVFLDADDWLLQDAFYINVQSLSQNPVAAFVSGAHEVFNEGDDKYSAVRQEIKGHPYSHLLAGNYIGMHAAVMYQRWLFDKFEFNTSLKLCEDYELYLRTARIFQVIHHTQLIAVYFIHEDNMSGNNVEMLKTVLSILSKQKRFLVNPWEEEFFNLGLNNWKAYYTGKIYSKLISQLYLKHVINTEYEEKALKLYNPLLYDKYVFEKTF